MDIDKFIKDKGLKLDCIVESDLDVKEYVQYEVRNLIKEAVNEQLRLCIVSQQRELLITFLMKVGDCYGMEKRENAEICVDEILSN